MERFRSNPAKPYENSRREDGESPLQGIDPALIGRAAIVGLGANMQNPGEMIGEALRRLDAMAELTLLAGSSIYLTEPQSGPPGQDWFHNAAAFFDSRLTPAGLLQRLLSVEADMGRVRREPNGPRVIDLDLLAFGAEVVNDPPDLVLPHPRMHQRRFVMAPLAEMAPDWRHPLLGRTAIELLRDIPPDGQGFRKLL